MRVTLLTVIAIVFSVIQSIAQGQLWGTAYGGGESNLGVIFKTNSEGTNYTVEKEFLTQFPGATPWYLRLCQATSTNGKLYGLLSSRILFEYDPSTGAYGKKIDLDGQPWGSLIQASNGKLYGMTNDGGTHGMGVLFEYDPVNNDYIKKVDFDGANKGKNPYGSLTLGPDNKLYGMTYSGGLNDKGVVFEFDPSTDSFIKKIDFDGNNGENPFGNLVVAPNGKLFGLTWGGGSENAGVLFEYNSLNNTLLKKLDFTRTNGSSPLGGMTVANNGKLYGMTYSSAGTNGFDGAGVLFEFDPDTYDYTVKLEFDGTNGAYPTGDLLLASNDKLYGLTNRGGGVNDGGVLFEYMPGATTIQKKLDFDPSTGYTPAGSLMQAANGKLYGTTGNGGPGLGVLFEYDFTTNAYLRKIDFSASPEGSLPFYGLMQAVNGKLYGYTYAGGEFGAGTIYELDPVNNTFNVKYDFPTDLRPFGKLVETQPGILFGSSLTGGANSSGVIFKLNLTTNQFTTVLSFDESSIGSNPNSLTVGANGKIYGTCRSGGVNSQGTIFEFDPILNSVTSKLDLNFSAGGNPLSALLSASNEKFYGLANTGGLFGRGTLFEYDPSQHTYINLVDFDSNTGTFLPGDLIGSSNGILYGLTADEGANGKGTLFEYTIQTNVFTKKIDFNGAEKGANPQGSLVKSSNNKLYGVTTNGGANNRGVLFEFDPADGALVKLRDFDLPTGALPIYVQLLYVAPRQNQTISFNTLPSKTIGEQPFDLEASTDSNLPITFISSDPSIASINGQTVTILKPGTVVVTASQEGNINYNPALEVQQELVINKISQVISFEAIEEKVFGGTAFDLMATTTSDLPITFTSSNVSVATINGKTVTILAAGSTIITAIQEGNSNYNAAQSIQQILTIKKANQTISFNAIDAKAYQDPSFTLIASATSGLAITFTSSNTAVATVSGKDITIVAPGTTTITASQSGNENFNSAQDVQQIFTVNKATQTITFEALPTKIYGDQSFTISASSSSDLPVTFTSSNTAVATIADNLVTIVSGGTSTITATQLGNSLFEEASSVDQTLTIGKADQTLTFTALSAKTIGDSAFELEATASSSLPVKFIGNNSKISISSNRVTLLEAGLASITAQQAGTSSFNAALEVTQTFCVNPAKPTITGTNVNTGSPILTSSAVSGNQWFKDGVLISGATGASLNIVSSGIYSVESTIENCKSARSNDFPMIVTGNIKAQRNPIIEISPNPAQRSITIKLPDEGQKSIIISDVKGKEIEIIATERDLIDIDVHTYASGLYFVKVKTIKNFYFGKFIKN